jgi:SM-20-related protein
MRSELASLSTPRPAFLQFDDEKVGTFESQLNGYLVRELREKGYIILDDFLPLEEAEQAHKALRKNDKENAPRRKKYFKGGDDGQCSEHRLRWLYLKDSDIEAPVSNLLHKMNALREDLNANCEFGSERVEIQVAEYPGDGTGFVLHLDATEEMKKRRMTCIYYSNPDWEEAHGGQLKVYLPGEQEEEVCHRIVEPVFNRVILFYSTWLPHEVLPCHHHRMAITMWFW